jgi:putative ABC transport system ATP-binding protein
MRAIVETSAGILAAQAVAVTKVYGHGSGAVTALDGVTVGFQAGTFTAGAAAGRPDPCRRP